MRLPDGPPFLPPLDPRRELRLSLGGDGLIVDVSPGWLPLAERCGIAALRPDRLQGTAAETFLDTDAARELRRFLDGALVASPGAMPPSLDGPFPLWQPWPIHGADGKPMICFRLGAQGHEALDAFLRRPLFTVCPDGRLESLGRRAETLQRRHPEVTDEARLDTWLAPFGYHLERISPWRSTGRPILAPVQGSLHGCAPFQILARTLRAALHDLSNPLAAVRMVAEVAGRGIGDPVKHLPGLLSHLDTVSSTVKSIRALVQVDLRAVPLDARGHFERAVELIGSELGRRAVQVDISSLSAPEPEIEAPRGAFQLLALGILLHRLGDAVDGDTVVLASTQDDETWTVEARLVPGDGPRPLLPDPFVDTGTLRTLATPIGGHIELDDSHDEAFELGPSVVLRVAL